MKFCKNLQRVVDISDPEWAPYWTNYKMLKKLIKELPSLVPVGEEMARRHSFDSGSSDDQTTNDNATTTSRGPQEDELGRVTLVAKQKRGHLQQHGDNTTEAKPLLPGTSHHVPDAQPESTRTELDARAADNAEPVMHEDHARVAGSSISLGSVQVDHKKEELGRSPGEIAFFKLLHAEFKKATHFFDKAQQEFSIREERVREGAEIMKQPNSIMVNEKWSLLAKSIYRLYKDLLLLETFAIMTYCSFSKILKKHDKVTGHSTRNAFMANVVNKANFTNYPQVLEMISRCERLYEDVSERLLQEGKEALYEDERLFINMIARLNEQVLDTAEGEGAPDRKQGRRQPNAQIGAFPPSAGAQQESVAVSTLRSLVAENDALASAAQVSEGHNDAEGDEDSTAQPRTGVAKKRSAGALHDTRQKPSSAAKKYKHL